MWTNYHMLIFYLNCTKVGLIDKASFSVHNFQYLVFQLLLLVDSQMLYKLNVYGLLMLDNSMCWSFLEREPNWRFSHIIRMLYLIEFPLMRYEDSWAPCSVVFHHWLMTHCHLCWDKISSHTPDKAKYNLDK